MKDHMSRIRGGAATADILWEAMRVEPEFPAGGIGPVRVWREKAYPWLVNKQISAMLSHRSPEPWLSVNCTLQAIAGDGFKREAHRFDGIVGGETTECEYQALIGGNFSAPIVVLGGFPRSGTTSIQTLLRVMYPSHIPEISTDHRRFSLWEYPKHDVTAMDQLSKNSPAEVRVIVASRRFEDAAASLAVGRGSIERVDLELKIIRWRAWMDLALSGRVISIPFEVISSLSPCEMSEAIARIIGLAPQRTIAQTDSYGFLMSSSKRGDTQNPRQSNTPSAERAAELSSVRAEVISRVGLERITELGDTYSDVLRSGMSAFGTVEPE